MGGFMGGVIAWFIGVSVEMRHLGDRSSLQTTDRAALGGADERGLSQSTENAVLLAGAVTVAGVVVAVITTYVKSHLPG